MKRILMKRLNRHHRHTLRQLWDDTRARFVRSDLSRLAALYRTDKFGHGYMPIYERHFRHLRRKKITILEIGIGGYGAPWAGGASLRMWAAYFFRGRVIGLDIADKSPHAKRRVAVFQGEQGDAEVLGQIIEAAGDLDIIVDDGSHFCSDVITSFDVLFPHLKPGGLYVIEDTQTSYWSSCGGSMKPDAATTMNHFKALADGLNHAEYPIADYRPSYTDLNILSIHFYHNLIVVEKGPNTRPSNVAVKDRMAAGEG